MDLCFKYGSGRLNSAMSFSEYLTWSWRSSLPLLWWPFIRQILLSDTRGTAKVECTAEVIPNSWASRIYPPPLPPPSTVKPQGHKKGSPRRAFLSSKRGNWNSLADVPVDRWRIGGVISDDTGSQSANKSKNSLVTSHQGSDGRHFSEWLGFQKLPSDLPV